MVKQKILKIKVGEVYIDKKRHPVYQTAWKSPKGYYVLNQFITPSEVEIKEKDKQQDNIETEDV